MIEALSHVQDAFRAMTQSAESHREVFEGRLIGPHLLGRHYLIKIDAELMGAMREEIVVDIRDYSEPVPFLQCTEGVCSVGEQRPIPDRLGQRLSFPALTA